jgi:nucleoside-diphosphate-sugar epimerase
MAANRTSLRTALVTGATGYIASHLIPALAESGWDVRATGRRRQAPPLPAGVEYVSLDLVKDEPWAISGLMESVTHVFHLAGASSSLSDQKEMELANVLGTRRMLRAAQPWPIERFVHMSSTSVYGEEVQLPSPVPEDVERHPSRGYGKAKDGAERAVEEYATAKGGGVPTVVLRPVTVYGPGNVKLLASAILDVAVERYAGLDRIAVPETPIEQRLVHVDDVVAASIHLATAPADSAVGRAFNVVLPQYPSSHEVAGMVADAFGLPVELVADPDAGLSHDARTEVHGRMVAAGMEPRILLSPERFRFLRKANRNNRLSVDALLGTGFEFGHTDLAAGIASTVDWYRAQRWVL